MQPLIVQHDVTPYRVLQCDMKWDIAIRSKEESSQVFVACGRSKASELVKEGSQEVGAKLP